MQKKKSCTYAKNFKKIRFFGNFFATGLVSERFLASRSRFFEKVNGLRVLGEGGSNENDYRRGERRNESRSLIPVCRKSIFCRRSAAVCPTYLVVAHQTQLKMALASMFLSVAAKALLYCSTEDKKGEVSCPFVEEDYFPTLQPYVEYQRLLVQRYQPTPSNIMNANHFKNYMCGLSAYRIAEDYQLRLLEDCRNQQRQPWTEEDCLREWGVVLLACCCTIVLLHFYRRHTFFQNNEVMMRFRSDCGDDVVDIGRFLALRSRFFEKVNGFGSSRNKSGRTHIFPRPRELLQFLIKNRLRDPQNVHNHSNSLKKIRKTNIF
ncbi:hypothetical protein LXL04_015130 [Taraxacum kok-saghyz]